MRSLVLLLFIGVIVFPTLGFADPGLPPLLDGRPALRFPIVLVHGASEKGAKLKVGFLNFGNYFHRVSDLFAQAKTVSTAVNLPTDSSIGERAAVLKNILETEFRDQKVNIVAHSLGGLDARYLVSILHSNQIASITTIGTPHYGSPLADWAVDQGTQRKFWYWVFRAFGFDITKRRFLPELTIASMKNFNEKVPNIPSVRYFSVRTSASFAEGDMSFMLWPTSKWLEGQRNPLAAAGHDGLVPLDSQGWGQELLTLRLDHLGQINHHEFRLQSMQKESLLVYTAIYEALAREGL